MLSPCYPVSLSQRACVLLSPCYPVSLSERACVLLSPCYPVSLSERAYVLLSPCYSLTLSACMRLALTVLPSLTLSAHTHLCSKVHFSSKYTLIAFQCLAETVIWSEAPVPYCVRSDRGLRCGRRAPVCSVTALPPGSQNDSPSGVGPRHCGPRPMPQQRMTCNERQTAAKYCTPLRSSSRSGNSSSEKVEYL